MARAHGIATRMRGAQQPIEQQGDEPDRDHADDDAIELDAVRVEHEHHLPDAAGAAAAAFAPTASSAATIAVHATPIAMRSPTAIDGIAPGTTTVRRIAKAAETHGRRRTQQRRADALDAGDGVDDQRKKCRIRDDDHRACRAGAEPQDRERQDGDGGDRPKAFDERIEVALDAAKRAHRKAERNRQRQRR